MSEDLERAIGPDRRTFIKRLVIGTAFAAPVVSSFTMSGVQAVFGTEVGAITGAANCNTTFTAPLNYPRLIDTFPVGPGGLNATTTDGAVSLHIVVPATAGLTGVCLSIWGADLVALDPLVPAGETPVSGYAVIWDGKVTVALSPLTLEVSDPAVASGDPIYKFHKVTGVLIPQGNASGNTWVVQFLEDPSFVVTGASGDDDDDDDNKKKAAQPATPVAAEARFTG